ncbi:MAG TPA: maltotransferase domain-containing protein, partial [Pseudomonas sp.]|uniref:maltotransferase domain-containing protein n=1 Tax=Pseudomonas sp. TaxID=306 RepID=UPI002D09C5A8
MPRIAIESIEPVVEQGRFAAKAIVGMPVTVGAVIFADGHDKLAGDLLWREVDEVQWHRLPLQFLGNDHWQASFTPRQVGRALFAIEAWWDIYASYCYELQKKYGAGVSVELELQEGEQLLRQALQTAPTEGLGELLEQLLECPSIDERVALLLAPETTRLMARIETRPHLLRSAIYPLEVERRLAQFASWYELFPRSVTDDPKRHGTFRDVIQRLPEIQAMDFDVLYFPPIHPIGRSHRKGRNNSLFASESDPGSPYAIGS